MRTNTETVRCEFHAACQNRSIRCGGCPVSSLFSKELESRPFAQILTDLVSRRTTARREGSGREDRGGGKSHRRDEVHQEVEGGHEEGG